ncbi:Maff2 family protein [Butyrivibrio sp. INlla16]|nr:Maff2 family protein [Butyrivibrio sp. INlla16]
METQRNCETQIIHLRIRRMAKNAVRKGGILRQNSALFIFGFRTKIQKTTKKQQSAFLVSNNMDFFNTAITQLSTVVSALGAGLGAWGVINLLEGYGNDNPGAKSQGMKQLMAGGGVVLLGIKLIPELAKVLIV